jgi:hypothetical protein
MKNKVDKKTANHLAKELLYIYKAQEEAYNIRKSKKLKGQYKRDFDTCETELGLASNQLNDLLYKIQFGK